MAKLNKTKIDKLTPQEKDYFVWDDSLPGFGLRVWPSGRKTYVVQYRSAGKTRRLKLGNHGPLTVEQARKEARATLGEVARGGDPQQERKTRRKSLTVAELCDDYWRACEAGLIAGKGGQPKKASTMLNDRGRIDRHIKPLLGNRLVFDLTRRDIVAFMNDVMTGKTATVGLSGKARGRVRVTGGRVSASRALGLLGGILAYAVDQGVIDNSPAAKVTKPADRKRNRRLTDDELKALGLVLRDALDQHPTSVAFCKLAVLTGWRKSEIEGLRWADLDLPNATATLDGKEGRSIRPLGAPVIMLLRQLVNPTKYVLPGLRSSGHFAGGYGAFKRLCARAGISSVSPHTARHTVVTKGQEQLGFSESLCGAVVGHRKSGTVTGDYTHFAPPILVQVASKISAEIAGIMGFTDLQPAEASSAEQG